MAQGTALEASGQREHISGRRMLLVYRVVAWFEDVGWVRKWAGVTVMWVGMVVVPRARVVVSWRVAAQADLSCWSGTSVR